MACQPSLIAGILCGATVAEPAAGAEAGECLLAASTQRLPTASAGQRQGKHTNTVLAQLITESVNDSQRGS